MANETAIWLAVTLALIIVLARWILRAPQHDGLEFMSLEQLSAEAYWARADGDSDNEFNRELARRNGAAQ